MANDVFNDILDLINTNNLSDDDLTITIQQLHDFLINPIYDSKVKEELNQSFKISSCPHCGKKLMNSKYQLRFKDLIVNLILA